MRATLTTAILSTLLLLPAGPASAQPGGDPLERHLYPPDLVMQHQNRIGLTDEQKRELRHRVGEAQSKFTELQWEFQDEAERLVELLAADTLDEERVIAQVDRVLDRERVIKHTQMRLMVRIRNLLTVEQRAELDRLRPAAEPPPRR